MVPLVIAFVHEEVKDCVPETVIFCHNHMENGSICFVTVQWAPYDSGLQLPIAQVPYAYLKQPEGDVDWARDVLALSLKRAVGNRAGLIVGNDKAYSSKEVWKLNFGQHGEMKKHDRWAEAQT